MKIFINKKLIFGLQFLVGCSLAVVQRPPEQKNSIPSKKHIIRWNKKKLGGGICCAVLVGGISIRKIHNWRKTNSYQQPVQPAYLFKEENGQINLLRFDSNNLKENVMLLVNGEVYKFVNKTDDHNYYQFVHESCSWDVVYLLNNNLRVMTRNGQNFIDFEIFVDTSRTKTYIYEVVDGSSSSELPEVLKKRLNDLNKKIHDNLIGHATNQETNDNYPFKIKLEKKVDNFEWVWVPKELSSKFKNNSKYQLNAKETIVDGRAILIVLDVKQEIGFDF